MNAFKQAIKAVIVQARDEGMTREEAAKALGISYCTLASRIREFGVLWPHGRRAREPDERAKEMVARSEAGESLEAIAADYGITRERVRQIVKKAGGKSKRHMRDASLAKLAEFLKANPMTLAEAIRATGAPQSAVENTKRHGVEFLKISQDREDELAPLAEKVVAGLSIYQAAGRDHVLEGRLKTYLNAKGIKSKASTRWSVSPERAETIARLFAEGKSWAEISVAVADLEGVRPLKASAIYNWAYNNMDLPKRAAEPKQRKVRQPRATVPRVKLERPAREPACVDIRDTVRETAIANRGRATASEIAMACGTSRNSIIGHWFRARQDGAIA